MGFDQKNKIKLRLVIFSDNHMKLSIRQKL